MKTNDQEAEGHKICLIDLYAGERCREARFYLSPLVHVPLRFQEEQALFNGPLGPVVCPVITKAILPFTEMDFVRRDGGIVDVQFRFSDVTVLEAKDCPFAN